MTETRLQFEFASDYQQMRSVQQEIVEALDARQFDDESQFAIKLSLEEALINAVKHGNRLDPDKHVKVDVRLSDQRFEITIRDQGTGFDRKDVPDPTLEDNREKPSGRGLLLMEAYMNEVQYTDNGRCLRMVRRNTRP